MTNSESHENILKLLSMGIYKPDKNVLEGVFTEMGDTGTADYLTGLSSRDFTAMISSSSVASSPGLKANLIVMYAGPGAGKSTVTNYLFGQIPLKWLVVYTTRKIRISENESIGNPFSKYDISWDEFDSYPDNTPDYVKTISTGMQGERTKGYIVDVVESAKLLEKGYNLIIHSWIWDEFIQRSALFDNTLTICLYVDYNATVKRLAYRNLVEAREKKLLTENIPDSPADTELRDALALLASLEDNSIYNDLLIRIESAKETRDRYETVLKPENISCFKYIADNSGNPVKAMKDVRAIVIADRYLRLDNDRRYFPEYFKSVISHTKNLESQNRFVK